MNGDARRKHRDPNLVEKLRARMAQIKIAGAAKRTEELMADWPQQSNMLEAIILRRRIEGEAKNGPRTNGA